MRIAVAGGTGLVGRMVAAEAERRGHVVVVLARAAGVDLLAGDDLVGPMRDVDAVVDVTNRTTQKRAEAEAFFAGVSERLLAAEASTGVKNHVLLSIVGTDGTATGYYHGKLRQEQVVTSGTVPWTILRTTQFHEFSQQALGFVALGPISMVPRMRIQPVAATEVAARLVDLAEQPASGRARELAGPEQHDVVDLARRVNAARQLGRRVVGVPLPGRGGAFLRGGGLLPQGDADLGSLTFDRWLAVPPEG